MRARTLFRVGLKLLGVTLLFVGLVNVGGIAKFILACDWQAYRIAYYSPGSFAHWSNWIGVAKEGRSLLEVVLGAYLLLGGRWIVNLAFPLGGNRCEECGYSLRGIKGTRCPECGAPFRSAEMAEGPGTPSNHAD